MTLESNNACHAKYGDATMHGSFPVTLSSCLELHYSLGALLVQDPCAAVSALDDVAALEQHLRSARSADVGHPEQHPRVDGWLPRCLIHCANERRRQTHFLPPHTFRGRAIAPRALHPARSPPYPLSSARPRSVDRMASPAPPLHATEKQVLDEFSGRRSALNNTHNKARDGP